MTHHSTDNLPAFIQKWKSAIEDGQSPESIAQSCYDPKGLLKGTVWSEVIQGHADIIRYFQAFTSGKNNPTVTFLSLTQSPSGSFAGEYIFKWTDNEGNAQSAEANYTFEPTNDNNLIALHHSSFFVT